MVDKTVLAASTAQKLSMGQQLLAMAGQRDTPQPAIVVAALQLLTLAIESYFNELKVQEATINQSVTEQSINVSQLTKLSSINWVTPEMREITEIATTDGSWLNRLMAANSELAHTPVTLASNGASPKEGLLNFVELSVDGDATLQSNETEICISVRDVQDYFTDFERMLLRHRTDMQEC